MTKKSSAKYIIGGVLLLGVFVFFMKHTASAFQTRARGQDNIRLFRGRSNFSGTYNQNIPFTNLAGNQSQRNLYNNSIDLMRRS